jgi:hypothetical protein
MVRGLGPDVQLNIHPIGIIECSNRNQLALFGPHCAKSSGTILHADSPALRYKKIPVTSKGIPR